MLINKHLRRILLGLLAGVLLLAIALHFISNYVEDRIRTVLTTIPLEASSVNANILTQTIELEEVDWTQANDSLPDFPNHAYVNRIRIEGISVYQLLANKKLRIRRLVLNTGEFQLNRNLENAKTANDQKKTAQKNINAISIGQIVLKDIYSKVSRDSIDEFEGVINLSLEKVALHDPSVFRELSSYKVNAFELFVTHVSITGKKNMYATTISRIAANSLESKIDIDSILLVPKYSKYQFSRKIGRQTDRMSLSIPKISIHDFSFPQVKDSLFKAALIEIRSAELHVFRDKRLPFIKEKNTPLPIAMIRDFKFAMAIDSLKIIDAKVTYEEFPEKGYHSGQITFENLNATLDHLTNRDIYPDREQATLKASSYVMGKGLLNAEFSLPYGKSQVYNAKGSLTNFSLYRLNPILENVAFVSVTSGKLNKLTFNFDYTDQNATGSVLVNYEDLKINSLTKEKDPEKNEIKTLVVNTILKKNKTEKLEKEKRMGSIDFERDKKRAIFHYWWRSLLTGIKSSMVELPNGKEKKKKEDEEKRR